MNNKDDYFGSYELSQATINSFKEIENLLGPEVNPADAGWDLICPKRKAKKELEEVVEKEIAKIEDDADTVPVGGSSTQFFFSQKDRGHVEPRFAEREIVSQWQDVAESLLESLESANDTLQLVHLTNLRDDQVESVIQYLSEKLSLKGTRNLCHSLCSMDVERSMRLVRITCDNLLLPKIVDSVEPSRLMITIVQELVGKFPEDVREFIFTPLLNKQISDASVFSAIVNSHPPQQKNDLILIFLDVVQELRDWHLGVLLQLMTSKLSDNVAKDKMLCLLLEKATIYSQDKNYGKFVLSFMKLNNPVTDNQKSMLNEMVAVNGTIFKKVMENLLKNMYFYGDLWHVA